jgi:hypothetical protein
MQYTPNPRGPEDVELQVQSIAERIAAIHGPVNIRPEASGRQIYFACPRCLEAYGPRELRSKHGALNVDRFLDQFAPQTTAVTKVLRRNGRGGKRKGYAQCMKEHGPFTLAELLSYPPLDQRGYAHVSPTVLNSGARKAYLIPDGRGGLMPDHPGKTVPLLQLPHDHPAHVYLRYRDFDPVLLSQHFDVCWCEEEAPEGEEFNNRFYRRHIDGWKSTPQGRVVFKSKINDVTVAWQARYLQIVDTTDAEWVWHPYRREWTPVPSWPAGGSPVKYLTSPGALRNSQLCGFDAVVAESRRSEKLWCVLTEGPLDAARFPNRGLALLGKHLSENQAFLISCYFRFVILAFDADEAGYDATRRAKQMLARHSGVTTAEFFNQADGAGGKLDTGAMTYGEARDRVSGILNRYLH